MTDYTKIEELTENLKKYASTNYELSKLEIAERTSVVGASLISNLSIALIVLLFLFFVSIGLCFYISFLLGDNFSGFFIVSGFYLVLGLVLYFGRKALIERPVQSTILSKIFDKN